LLRVFSPPRRPGSLRRAFHATTTSGEKFTSESIKGKVVLFEFWATWCGYCDHEAPYVDQIAKEFTGKGLIVLAIDVGESKKTVKRYLEAHPRSVPIVLMEDTNLAAMYQANVYPIYVLIDGGVHAVRSPLARYPLEA
jgi:thiol-disulfide isomerase/thioredoxin